MNEKKNVNKFQTTYMLYGLSIGMMLGMLWGEFMYEDNLPLGMCLGMSLGMCLGIVIGSAKDKKLSEQMLKLCRIEDVPDSTDKMIYVLDKNGEEKEYRVTEKQQKEEQFTVGDRVAEEENGRLVSLENKQSS